ncbi:MAG: sugar O-acetyltransferase [Lentisphaerota bacterium]
MFKTEKEKSLSGQLYNANYDKELIAERQHAKTLCYEYNKTPPGSTAERIEILRKLLGKTYNNLLIEQPFFCDYGYNIEIGENFYMNHGGIILDGARVKFGDNVFIGPNCGFYTPNHPFDKKQRSMGLEYVYPITVGDDVWFGGGVIVLSGITIGNNVVIGAGSVVTKDIPSGVVAAGNPCRIIRKIS